MKFKLTWVLLAVAAIVAGYFFLVDQPQHKRNLSDQSVMDVLTEARREDVTEVRIQRPESTLEFARENGEWWMTNPFREKADQASVNTLLQTIVALKIDQRYATDENKLSTYGLENPPIVITLLTHQGEPLVMDVGDFNINKSQCYARVRATDEVLLVHAALRRYGFRDESFFRSKRVFEFTSDDVSSASIAGRNGEFSWKRTLPDSWLLVSDGDSIDADTQAIATILSELRALRVSRNVSDKPDDYQTYFAETVGSISITTVGSPGSTVFVFAEIPDSDECLATIVGEPRIMAVGRPILANFRKTLSDFRDRHVMRFDRGEVTRMSLEGPDVLMSIVKRDDTWTFNNPAMGDIRQADVSKLLVALMELKYKEIIHEVLPEPRPYGLDAPTYRLSIHAGDRLLDRFDTGDTIQPGAEEYITGLSSGHLGKVDSESLTTIKGLFANFTSE